MACYIWRCRKSVTLMSVGMPCHRQNVTELYDDACSVSTLLLLPHIQAQTPIGERTVSRSHWPCGLRPLACWNCGFEFLRGHGYRSRSRVSVVCCQVDICATDRSLVQRGPTDCGVSECDREASILWRPWPTRGCCPVLGGGMNC